MKWAFILLFCINTLYPQKIKIPLNEYKKRVSSQQNRFLNIKELWNFPYNLNGKGEKIAIFDGGGVDINHIEFQDVKILQKDLKINQHSTSIVSIIVAKGKNKYAKGIANKAILKVYNYKKYKYYDAIKKALDDGILISNHSYANPFLNQDYNIINQKIDNIVYKNPHIIAIFASGEEKGFRLRTIPISSASKNVLTISPLDETQTKMIKISPLGPTKDFRIKPDLCFRGLYVLTPEINTKNSYAIYRGSSISTAFVTASIALLSQAYKRKFHKNIRFDTLKALLINNADDIIKKGVDFFSGYGRLNLKKSVDFLLKKDLKNYSLFSFIKNKEHKTFHFKLKKDRHLKISICWIDPAAKQQNFKNPLINDIDIFISSQNKTYYPYSVNKEPLKIVKQPNHHDNCEQIKEDLKKGDYTLNIYGYKIKNKQSFSLVSNTPIF